MSDWRNPKDGLPAERELVLVWFGNLHSYGLRSRVADDWYDEDEDYDDSEIPIVQWHTLPEMGDE